jgi:uncharacterized protein (DUF1778 family)
MALARKKNLNIRMTDAEHRMLGELAGTNGLSVSDYVRQHIRKAHDFLKLVSLDLDLTTPPKKVKR